MAAARTMVFRRYQLCRRFVSFENTGELDESCFVGRRLWNKDQ